MLVSFAKGFRLRISGYLPAWNDANLKPAT
jgi:hypothetical protein